VSLTCIHVLISIIGDREDRSLPWKGVAAPKTSRCSDIGRSTSSTKDLLHRIGIETLSYLRGFDVSKNLGIIRRCACRSGNVLLNGKFKRENHRRLWKLLFGWHCKLKVNSLKTHTYRRFSENSRRRAMDTSVMLQPIITREELFDFSRRCAEQFEKEEEERRQYLIDDKVKFYRLRILQAAAAGKVYLYEQHTGLLMKKIVAKLELMFPGVLFQLDGMLIKVDWSGSENESNFVK
jgi:hypothetical protein